MATFKQIFLLFALALGLKTFAQTKQSNLNTDSVKIVIPFKQKDTTYWVDNFRQFRDAIFHRDKTKAKAFFNFPIKDESNEIWYLAYSENDKSIDKLGNIAKPFTEVDFDKYFDNIFSKNFVKSLLQIKVDELYKKGTFDTSELKDSSTTCILLSSYDKTEHSLQLNLNSNTPINDDKGQPIEAGEFSIIYYFEITKQGHIKFKKIMLAG